jgi:hypothetical protein
MEAEWGHERSGRRERGEVVKTYNNLQKDVDPQGNQTYRRSLSFMVSGLACGGEFWRDRLFFPSRRKTISLQGKSTFRACC